jgi:uncharacterized protein YeaO (DUF488 family)
MALRVVRLGTPRLPDEGLRVGTVRHPPRGVRKEEFAKRDFYDVWYPVLSPSSALVKQALAAETDQAWGAFVRAFRREMATPDARHALGLLAALSHGTNLSVGCYCEDPARCHRSVLRELLAEEGAELAEDGAAPM